MDYLEWLYYSMEWYWIVTPTYTLLMSVIAGFSGAIFVSAAILAFARYLLLKVGIDWLVARNDSGIDLGNILGEK